MTTPEQRRNNFTAGLRQVLSVSKADLAEREKEYQAERKAHPKRGPKPKTSASDHASDDKDQNGSGVVDTGVSPLLPVSSL